MIDDNSWISKEGADLVESYKSATKLDSELPSSPGVYMWKLNLTANISFTSESETNNKILTLLNSSFGGPEEQFISHNLQVKTMEFHGKGLPPAKEPFLKTMLNDREARLAMRKFLERLTIHQPTLYVGDAENLSERIVGHVNGSSGFAKRLKRMTSWGIEDLRLYYIETPSVTEEERKTIESIVTILSGAWLVRRQG